MRILCDTNILVRSIKPDDPHHDQTIDCLGRLVRDDHNLVIVPQCIYEFYVVSTRPIENNGLGLVPSSALDDIEDFNLLFQLYRDERTIFDCWVKIVNEYSVSGKPTHDARLVAAMMRHGIDDLLTWNDRDFRRYSEINVHTPSSLLQRIN